MRCAAHSALWGIQEVKQTVERPTNSAKPFTQRYVPLLFHPLLHPLSHPGMQLIPECNALLANLHTCWRYNIQVIKIQANVVPVTKSRV